MSLGKDISAFVIALLMAQAAVADPRDPIGEFADYQIDRDPDRTTSYIRSGTLYSVVESFNAGDAENEPSYSTRIDYDFNIQWIGRRQGTSYIDVPQEYFTEEFKEELRTTGYYESDKFKVEHLGYADGSNMDGAFYPNCDVIRIYDIQDVKQADFITALMAPRLMSEEIENLEIVAHIADGMPVLGAVKIDMSGDYQGMPVKAGGDYYTP
jgi:hypothetical protein